MRIAKQYCVIIPILGLLINLFIKFPAIRGRNRFKIEVSVHNVVKYIKQA